MNNILSINFINETGGHGKLEIDLSVFLPCSKSDFNNILRTCGLSNECDDLIKQLHDYIADQVRWLQDEKNYISYAELPKGETRTGMIKKYIGLNDILVTKHGAEQINDEFVDFNKNIRLKSGIAHALQLDEHRKQVVVSIPGWTFEKGGYTFEVYAKKYSKYTEYIILLAGTGRQTAYAKKKTEIIAAITPELLEIINKQPEKIEQFKKEFDRIQNGEQASDNKTQNNETSSTQDNETKNSDKTAENNKQEDKTMKQNNTNINYFNGVKNLDELRSKYRDLIKANHPDNGGDTEIMKQINLEYKKAFDILKSGAHLDDKTDNKEKVKWNEAEDEALRAALYNIIHLDGLNIEIVGCWIWVDGATYLHKDELKTAGYKWSSNRKKWHFAPYESAWHKGNKKSFDEIRRKYGSSEVETESQNSLTA